MYVVFGLLMVFNRDCTGAGIVINHDCSDMQCFISDGGMVSVLRGGDVYPCFIVRIIIAAAVVCLYGGFKLHSPPAQSGREVLLGVIKKKKN